MLASQKGRALAAKMPRDRVLTDAEGDLAIDFEDEVVAGACVVNQGEAVAT